MAKYWKSLTELKKSTKLISKKAPAEKGNMEMVLDIFDEISANSKSNRRDFLKLCGYSLAISTIASSCENSVQKAIPYLIQPEEITPGKANHYASSYMDGNEYCSILVKTREGRPIKIEGNNLSGVTMGGTSARVQAAILGLYDTSRYKHPLKNGKKISWEALDQEVMDKLNACTSENGRIVLLTPTVFSPSTLKVIETFSTTFPTTEWVQYDTISVAALLKANEIGFGKSEIPDYRFDEADVIMSFGADFLGNWLMPIEFIHRYAKTRKLNDGKKKMSRHIQLEANLSLTGSNADQRIPIKPSEEGIILAHIYNEILKEKGQQTYVLPSIERNINTLVDELLKTKGRSLVVSGSNDLNIQLLVNAINYELGNYGKTIHWDHSLKIKQAMDEGMVRLVKNMNQGNIKALLLYGVNPVYDYHEADEFIKGMQNVPFTLSLATSPDETSELAGYVAPGHHFLESWNDAEPKTNFYSLAQPVIHPLFDTRQAQSSLLQWSGADANFYNLVRTSWAEKLFPLQKKYPDPDTFWNYSLQKGVFEATTEAPAEYVFNSAEIVKAMEALGRKPDETGLELIFYESITQGTGRQANNPWLHELSDPVSKICWDNFVSISPKQAREMGLETGNLVEINGDVTLPVYVQPGQAYNTAAIALGYGRRVCGKVGKGVGQNVYPLITLRNYTRQYYSTGTTLKKQSGTYTFALTQTHHSMEGRAIVREASLKEYLQNPAAGNKKLHKEEGKTAGIYKLPEFPKHHWGIMIDLNSCVGCGACVVACQAENNIPVVGKNEVVRAHEMHWMRVDRYFLGDEENPDVVFQPVMCQHCDNAPCENVCPVAATNHNSEGLNQMIYNRCIGTRYCNNNCPYKVRRFNWYDYTQADSIPNNLHDVAGMTLDLKRMVLNPDVTVRAKGVIEKCSLCLQRIQEGKLNAKLEDRTVKDGEIKTACQQACPAGAIVFGDLKDANSRLSRLTSGERNYHLLDEIHTLPSVSYLTKIRNRKFKKS